MEKIGYTNSFLNKASALFASLHDLEESREQKVAKRHMEKMLAHFKGISKHRDIPLLLLAEGMMLRLELDKRANSPEEKNSILAALVQLSDAQRAMEVVKNHHSYEAATKTYSSRQREAGLPLDAFREFIKSHTTRLTNKLSAPLSVAEKNLLRQRKENLKVAKEMYAGLQREALGLAPVPAKGIEIEM